MEGYAVLRDGCVVERVDGQVRVAFERTEACGNCTACDRAPYRILLPGDAQPGDGVAVEMPDKSLVHVAALAYGFPLGMLLLGMLAGWLLHGRLGVRMDAELFSALCGGLFLMGAVGALYLLDKRLRLRQDWQPRIVAVYPQKCLEDRKE
jgi:positive regulator of sigma E activity